MRRAVICWCLLLVLLGCCRSPLVVSLTVHLVPHSHDDVGYRKTVDQYFIGSNSSLAVASVDQLLTGTLASLIRIADRKFVIAEQAFFQRWWRQQSDEIKAVVRSLVKRGQIEFVNGGWCMHDEATTHYIDMIDQTTLGHQYILREFGEAANPTVGWQLDPFGHSATQASLLGREAGFDSLFFGRIDYQDHNQRIKNKEMQFIWAPSPSLGQNAQVWTEVAYDGNYAPPPSFCWDIRCVPYTNHPLVQDRDDLEDKNVDSRVADFIRVAYQYAETRKGDLDTMNIQFNMGNDFAYMNAERFYINMDKIIRAVNRNGTIRAQYSTPSLYYKAKMAEDITWSTKTDDFFPYASGAGIQWTGFYTSRPGLKGYVRSSSVLLQIARQLEVFTGGDGTGTEPAWEAVAVAQHHDAVTGTSKQHVAYDYSQRLYVGNLASYRTIEVALSALSANGSELIDFVSCPLLNISVCPPTLSGQFAVLVYSPSTHSGRVNQLTFPLPARAASVSVRNSAGEPVSAELVPVPRTSASTEESATLAVSFADDQSRIPSLGYETYIVTTTQSRTDAVRRSARRGEGAGAAAARMQRPSSSTVTIQNEHLRLTFDSSTGLVTTWTTLSTGVTKPFTQQFYFYSSSVNMTYGVSQLYTFQPTQGTQLSPVTEQPVQLTFFKGTTVQMVNQRWNDWLSQTWRLYSSDASPEVEWTVGPIAFEDGTSREIVTKYNTDIGNQAEWFTDANGREFQRRVRNQRPSFNFTLVSPISSNYYPVTTGAYLNDSDWAFGVLVDRAEGVSSLEDGSLELMLHRRLLCISCAPFENLNETDQAVYDVDAGELVERLGRGLIVTGKHRLLSGSPSSVQQLLRLSQQQLYTAVHPVFAPLPDAPGEIGSGGVLAGNRVGRLSFLKTPLPVNVELMTLQLIWDGSVLLRLAHSFAVGEGEDGLDQPVNVDLSTLFVQPIRFIQQRTITANADYSTIQARAKGQHRSQLKGTTVTIHPMQIVTLAVTF